MLGSDVGLENGEPAERWWHKAADPRRMAELPRLEMNRFERFVLSISSQFLLCPARDRGRLFLMEVKGREGVEGGCGKVSK